MINRERPRQGEEREGKIGVQAGYQGGEKKRNGRWRWRKGGKVREGGISKKKGAGGGKEVIRNLEYQEGGKSKEE